MLTRLLAILLAPVLPMAALIFPMSAAHRIDALICGVAASALSAFALASDRARIAGAVVAAWVALTAFIFPSTLLEEMIALSWGTLMVAWLAGPLSAQPRVFIEKAALPSPTEEHEPHLPLAA